MEQYAFLDAEAPESVNPSLWRQAQLNKISGLFTIHPRIHQVRGHDLSNMTLVQGDTGWIVIAPLTSLETARASLLLANDKLGARPVVAVIYTHSHADHFDGVRGVIDEADVKAGRVPVIAPDGCRFNDGAGCNGCRQSRHAARFPRC
jgi:alkyl sulfatase BDS1-like metallo-beta-lactamase superfamily hydrolase